MTRFYKALQSEETEDYRSNLEREGAQGERLDVQNDITYEPQQDEEECKQNQPNIELQIDKDEPSAQKQLPQ